MIVDTYKKIEVTTVHSRVWIHADCFPEMKKDIYKVAMSLCDKSFAIQNAMCGCKAGQGPKASCKHVGELCYAFAELCKSGQLLDFLTCTEQLQKWNQPRPKKLELGSRKNEILKKEKENPLPVPSKYDPHPSSMRAYDPDLIETMRVNLLDISSPGVLLSC